ncbi:MAG: aldose 1-epimerase family protein [Sphingomonas sp.]|uniref:aldose 1-epimerase family protein n=1 Tax=Sphingomonas sp. TaxID=28214 RepID=UPI001AC41009|nr:aldose 1-epimerase family protein [Sphingomonas sp.]MBN8815738.1 aldose 1-epimerase family protein [Sphingomonas sp.]
MIELVGPGLSATINPLGAELISLRDAQGRELMTDADPAFWTGHAPILFPIVGRLNGDVLRIGGRDYPMKQHGFARRMTWDVVGAGADAVTLRLRDDEATRASYPFAFDLAILYAIEETSLSWVVRVSNPGQDPLPFSIGFHPAFAWPLPYGQPRGAHRIVFDREEEGRVIELQDGLFAATRPSPLAGRALALADDLFADDALIWSPVASQSVTYGAADGPQLRVDFPDTPDLGVWTKPGARFVCIEPWHGHADPAGFTGDFRDKPGVIEIAPGDEWTCSMQVTLLA